MFGRGRMIAWLAGLVGCCAGASAQTAGLVGYWNFNESSGTIAHNSVAGGPDGILSGGATFVPAGGGMYGGNAIRLDHGTNGMVNFGDNYNFATGSFSVVVWVKLTGGDATPMVPISRHETGTANGYLVGIGDVGDGAVAPQSGKAHFYDSGFASLQIGPTVNNGAWHMLVGTYDESARNLSITVDAGNTAGSAGSQPMVPTSAPLLVGGVIDAGVSLNRFDGLVDEVRLYNHKLSSGEILSIYSTTLPEPASAAVLSVLFLFLHRASRVAERA